MTNYLLYAKTGAGKANSKEKSSKAMLGWYVGFVENDKGTCIILPLILLVLIMQK